MSDGSDHARPLVPVRVCGDDAEAEVLISLLRDYGIEAFANSAISHRVLPVSAGRLGQVTVYVDEANAEKATDAIRQAETGG